MKKIKLGKLFTVFICSIILNSCINPFAPTIIDSDIDLPILGDQTTIEGFFQNFRYAYNLRDTVVYGNLLADDFTFHYRNYEKNLSLSWSRPEDMLTTYGLFNAVQNLEFIWNEIVRNEGNEIERVIERGFHLTINFSPTDVVRVYGRVNFALKRKNENENWKLFIWQDESNYF